MSISSHKQSGFTLIELMVVMAIIAILATAGLSAYTGYIKKARDTTRIADLNAINTLVISSMSDTGKVPTLTEIYGVISSANNGQMIRDPLATAAGVTKPVCLDSTGIIDNELTYGCEYFYIPCDDGLGYALTAQFESRSNISLYSENRSGFTTGYLISDATCVGGDIVIDVNDVYDIGSCKSVDDYQGVTNLSMTASCDPGPISAP